MLLFTATARLADNMDRSDEVIRSDVVEALSRDSRFNMARITVAVASGRVTLCGDAPTLYTIDIACELSSSVRGVVSVCSDLKVSRSAASPDDAEIRRVAEQILRYNASIGGGNIRVTVNEGAVTLRGEVDAYWKRNRAMALMLDIQGVIDVVNELAVVPELIPQDEVIADDVKSAIERFTSLGQDSISVEVHHGLVTLTGNVPSLLSKHNTPHIAECILGVKGVIDKLVVTAD
jgi:osmotically-inducible protein OsmY